MSPVVLQQPLSTFTDKYTSVDEFLAYLLKQGILDTWYKEHHENNEIEIEFSHFSDDQLQELTASEANQKLNSVIERMF